MNEEVSFAVAIVTYRQYARLNACIDSIRRSTLQPTRIVVVDNGGGYSRDCPQGVEVIRPARNLGVAGAWNLIHTLTEPLPVIISNDDVVFGPTALETLLEETGDMVVAKGKAWACFKQAHHLWRSVGLYDELIYPAYMEDSDYHRRLSLAGVPVKEIEVDVTHQGGGTRFSLPQPEREMLEWYYRLNEDYYIKKWGGPLGRETFSVPFNDEHFHEHPTPMSYLASQFARACMTDTDIHEHLPVLLDYGKQCQHITEFGVRQGQSTLAWLYAQPNTLVCYDVDQRSAFTADLVRTMAVRTQLVFHHADVRFVTIEPTDLLFTDTYHSYQQLDTELKAHAHRVRKFIIIHDTTTYGERGEDGDQRGLRHAVLEFLGSHGATWKLRERRQNNNGLTVLERVVPRCEVATLDSDRPDSG